MSFEGFENSNFAGRPVDLFEFRVADKVWRYTSSSKDQTHAGQVYFAIPISRGAIKQSGEPQNERTPIKVIASNPVVRLFAGTGPAWPVYVIIRTRHVGDNDAKVMLSGIVTNLRDVSPVEAEFSVQTLAATFNQPGLRLGWGRQCPHALYDKGCKVNRHEYAVGALVERLDGGTLWCSNIAERPAGWFTNGFFEFVTASGILDRRGVELHAGDSIRVLGPTDGIAVNDLLTFYPGCNRTIQMCAAKFSNHLNCGAIPEMPGRSPFDGAPVF